MANPETCWHNIVAVKSFSEATEAEFFCASCDTGPLELTAGYVYDGDHYVWVYDPSLGAKRATSAAR